MDTKATGLRSSKSTRKVAGKRRLTRASATNGRSRSRCAMETVSRSKRFSPKVRPVHVKTSASVSLSAPTRSICCS